jgi:hypothetical protein
MSGDLYLNTTPNIRGIKPVFWFVSVKDVASQVGATVTLTAGKQWNTAKGIKRRGFAKEKKLGSKLFGVGITAAIAHYSPGLDLVLQSYTGADGFLVIYDDLNGYRWLMGSLKQPLQFNYDNGSGDNPASSGGLKFNFSGKVSGVAKLEYTDAIDASVPAAPQSADSVAVKNSDGTYDEVAAAGSIHVIPDITITKNDDTTISYPAAKDMDLGVLDPPITPADWAEMVALVGRGYAFPTVSQKTQRWLGDTVWVENTYFDSAVRAANSLKAINSIDPTDWSKLLNTNAFGTLNHFTDINGLQVYGDNYIINHYNGLGCLNVYQADMDWETALSYALAANDLSFDDWFAPSNEQHESIIDYELSSVRNYAPFNISSTRTLVSSTTYGVTPTSAWTQTVQGILTITGKTSASPKLMMFRKHY